MPMRARGRYGSLVLCVPNLEINSANELLLMLVSWKIHQNIVVISPSKGPFANHFFEKGCSVRIGLLHELLHQVNQVFLVICSTLSTIDQVANYCKNNPTMLILHKYWTKDVAQKSLDEYSVHEPLPVSADTIKTVFSTAGLVIFQSKAQMRSYNEVLPAETPRTVIYVGSQSSEPLFTYDTHRRLKCYLHNSESSGKAIRPPMQYNPHRPYLHLLDTDFAEDTYSLQKIFFILSMGEIAPWENQIWIIQQFKQLRHELQKTLAISKAGIHLKLLIVRVSPETSTSWALGESAKYLPAIKALAEDDSDIEVHEYTDIQMLYHLADCVLLANTGKIVPQMVIESMARSVPLLLSEEFISENLITDGEEGFYFSIAKSCLPAERIIQEPSAKRSNHLLTLLTKMVKSQRLCDELSRKARMHFEKKFTTDVMLDNYRNAFWFLVPPIVLVDLDHVIMDVDRGFMEAWRENFERNPLHARGDVPSDESVGGGSAGGISLGSANSGGSSSTDTTFLVGDDDGMDKVQGRTRVDSNETKQGSTPSPVSSSDGGKQPPPNKAPLRHVSEKMYDMENIAASPEEQFSKQQQMQGQIGSSDSPADADIPVVHRAWSPDLWKCVDAQHQATAKRILKSRYFFRNLKPLEGALQGLLEMLNNGLNIMLVAQLNETSEFAVQERLSWIGAHLGEKWIERSIFVEDKTCIRAEVLIDTKMRDYPLLNSSWHPVLFDMPFNRRAPVSIPRINHWFDWSEIILSMFNKEAVPGSLKWSRDAANFPFVRSVAPPSLEIGAMKSGYEEKVMQPTGAPASSTAPPLWKPVPTTAQPTSYHISTEKCQEIRDAESKWDSFAKALKNASEHYKPPATSDPGASTPVLSASMHSTLPGEESDGSPLSSLDDEESGGSNRSSDEVARMTKYDADTEGTSTPAAGAETRKRSKAAKRHSSSSGCSGRLAEGQRIEEEPAAWPACSTVKSVPAVMEEHKDATSPAMQPPSGSEASENSKFKRKRGTGGGVAVTGEPVLAPAQPQHVDNAYAGADLTGET